MKLPSPSRSAQENAKYCSLFFRPWTNLIGSVVVPNITLLGCNRGVLQTIYSHRADWSERPMNATTQRKKTAVQSHSVPKCLNDQVHWAEAWDEYVRGHVATETAAHLIQSFLLKNSKPILKFLHSRRLSDREGSTFEQPYFHAGRANLPLPRLCRTVRTRPKAWCKNSLPQHIVSVIYYLWLPQPILP